MQETAPFVPPKPTGERESSFLKLIVGVAVVVVGAIAAYDFFVAPKSQPVARSQRHLAFGPKESEYASKIKFENIAMSRAENFAHQEITSLSGELVNQGDSPLKAVEITVEFSDEMAQIVLRESRILFGLSSAPVPAGGRREFEVSFEHVPTSWNMQQPVVRVTGLQLK
jgi:hypothetical protein